VAVATWSGSARTAASGWAMMPPAKAERLNGYQTGGIIPFCQRRPVPVAFEADALGFAEARLHRPSPPPPPAVRGHNGRGPPPPPPDR
ncbi:hypothetical protein VB636_10125, partial [Paracoccus sp. APAP_BH8]